MIKKNVLDVSLVKRNYFNQGYNEPMKILHGRNMDFLNFVVKKFNLNFQDKKILDVGAGSGDMARLFISSFNPKEYTALDFDNFLIFKKNIKFVKSNLNQLSEINNFLNNYKSYFDCILLFDIIEHIVYFDYFLSNIHKLLKPNGCVIIGLPLDINLSSRVKMLFKNNIFSPFNGVHGHINLFSYKDISRLRNLKSLKLVISKKCGLGYGLYDEKYHLNLLADLFNGLCSRIYLFYKKV